MEQIKTFLDTSTIHGLSYISSSRKWSRLFWILVVIGGFSGAGYLIYESFDNWHQSPISTTIETLPISQITFPNVTVCPPKNLFLNLNYDILQAEKVKLDKNKRETLIEASLVVIQDHFHMEIMRNLSKVEDLDRYYNWYHGYTQIRYPYHTDYNILQYNMNTYATSGNISTQYFDEKFDASKVDSNIRIGIDVNVPPNVVGDNNITLMLDINKRIMKEVSDKMMFCYDCTYIDADLTHWRKNITAPTNYYSIQLIRRASQDEIRNMSLDMMPGFRLTWKYNKHIQPEAKDIQPEALSFTNWNHFQNWNKLSTYKHEVKSKEFVK